jgi:putative NADH-flavin reductase
MMKLVVLGASGGCGRLLVTQAAARGHTVTAVARASSRLDAPSGVRALRGALDDEGFLREAVRGADAVLSALGLRLPGIAPWSRPEDPGFLDRSTPAVVRAMKAEGVGRAVVISAGGVADSYEEMPAAFKMFIRGSALRHVYPALARMEKTWLESGLDVCIPRPTGLTDESATGRCRVVARVEGRATIPRADVAAWMLDALAAPRFEARTPLLTVTGAD